MIYLLIYPHTLHQLEKIMPKPESYALSLWSGHLSVFWGCCGWWSFRI